jgi:hypothetical protein
MLALMYRHSESGRRAFVLQGCVICGRRSLLWCDQSTLKICVCALGQAVDYDLGAESRLIPKMDLREDTKILLTLPLHVG